MTFCRACGATLAPGVAACPECDAPAPRVAAGPGAPSAPPARGALAPLSPARVRLATFALLAMPAALVLFLLLLRTQNALSAAAVAIPLALVAVTAGLAWSLRRGRAWTRWAAVVLSALWGGFMVFVAIESARALAQDATLHPSSRATMGGQLALSLVELGLAGLVVGALATAERR